MDDVVNARYRELETLAQRVQQQLEAVVTALKFQPEVSLLPPDQATYRLEKDPYNGEHSLVGEWRDRHGMKLGVLLFHADGSFFVEQDVIRQHPTKPQWFVEAVNAWGKGDAIKAEARLLRVPE